MKLLFQSLVLISLLHLAWGQTATIRGNAGGAIVSGVVTVIVDSDRDGLPDSVEDANHNGIVDTGESDFRRFDTDGDGLGDMQDSQPTIHNFQTVWNADTDNPANASLFAAYNFTAALVNGQLDYINVRNWSGNGRHGKAWLSTTNSALPSPVPQNNLAGMSGAGFLCNGQFFFTLPKPISGGATPANYTAIKSLGLWLKPEVSSLTSAQPIFSYVPNGADYRQTGNTSNPWVMRAMIRPKSSTELELVLLSWEFNGTQDTVHTGWNLTHTPAQLEERWIHIGFTYKSGSQSADGWKLYVNGVQQTRTSSSKRGFLQAPASIPPLEEFFIGADITDTSTIPRKVNKVFAGRTDRVQLFNDLLTEAQISAIANYDTDGDGLNDAEEVTSGYDPAHYDQDADRDGLTNAEEVAGQATFNSTLKVFGPTNRGNFDTDGDLFDDYWEAKYFAANVNPNDATKPLNDNPATTPIIEGDYDNDGLSNYSEMLYGTDPNLSDTDGDSISDKNEVDYGSEPTNSASVPLNPADFYGAENLGSFAPIGNLGVILKAAGDQSPLVTARVGDPSPSHSERWRMRIGSKKIVAPNFGTLSDPVSLALDPTKFHEINIEHVATDPVWLATGGTGKPDYDYWAAVKPASGSPFILCDLEDLLQDPASNPLVAFLNGVDPDQVRYKTAYLVPLNNFSWATSYSGGDAVGPKHRKIALNGRPLTDEKPQQEEETDQASEETYIDAFNLSLRHDTTFTYLPLASSQMVLQASASSDETSFTSRSGLKPSERLDLPFGVGWSSSLCSYIEVVETLGDESDDPIAVNVVDEAGHPQRFGTNDFQSFFPWPSTRVDRKTYQNTLVRNGTSFTLRKKFGTTLQFAPSKAWFMYSSDRLDGSTTVRRHTYWRLTEAQDRYGVRLQYDYDSSPGVPNFVSLIPRKISSPDREGQALIIQRSPDSRRIESITDSRGNTTHFNYTFASNEYAISGGFAGGWKLDSVTFADNTQTHYTYESAVEQETDLSDPENIRFTYHYHTNLKSVTDKRGNTHTFSYVFDQSKRYWDSSVNGTSAAVDLDLLPPAVKAYVENEIATRNQPGKGQWKTMYGQARRVSSVQLPGAIGTANFVSQGGVDFNNTVTFTGSPSTTVTDTMGNVTVYAFESPLAEIVDVDASPKSISKEWMIYYLTSKIHHGGLPTAPAYLGTETYEFDPGSGLSLWRATDMSGNVTRWEFNDTYGAIPQGLPGGSPIMTRWSDPTAKIDALNRRENYTYHGSFRVMDSITDPYDTLTQFAIDGLGNRKSKLVKQNGLTSLASERYDYSNQRFKVFQTASTQVAFSNISGQLWETDLKTTSLADNHGRVWREITDPDGEKLTREHGYDLNNNRTTTRDPRGSLTRFKYDKLNRLVLITYPSAGTRGGEAVAEKQIWYDLNGNKAVEIDEEGNYIIHHYDVLNRRITSIRDMDGLGLPTCNADGLVTEATKGNPTGNDLVTRILYNAVSSVTHQIDARGTTTRTFRDAIQRPTHVFTGLTQVQANGDLATCTTLAAASNEITHTELRYTDSGLTFPGSGTTLKGNPGGSAFDSSAFKPTTAIRYAAVRGATGTYNLKTYAAYDALYRPLRTETEYEPNIYSTATTTYGTIIAGKESLITTSTDARNKITRTSKDGLQRTISVTDAFGTPLAATTQSLFSSIGLLWKAIDPLGREAETDYDKSARPVAVWQPDPITGLVNRTTPNNPLSGSPRTQTAYDKNNNVTVTINPLGYRWENEYDARDRKTLERQPTVTRTEIINGQPVETPFIHPVTRTAFDGVGNPIAITDPRGHITRSFHDKAYRVTHTLTNPVTGNPSTNPQTPAPNDIFNTTLFDANSNILEITDGNGNATRNQYDRQNRLVKTATNPSDGQPNAPPTAPKPGDIVVSNQYDDSNNLTQLTDGEGHLTGFRYDGLNRKTRTLWDEGSAVQRTEQATYDGLVQLTRIDPKNQLTTYQYDALHRLQDILYQNATTDNRHYQHDLAGNLLAVTYPNETPSRQVLRSTTQVFDKLNRLKEETSAGVTHSNSYDKANNRRTTTYGGTGRQLTSTYDKLNRLLTLGEGSVGVPPASFTSYGYDLTSNITRKTLPNNTATLSTFDAQNRKLTEATKSAAGALISSFDYSNPAAGYPSSYDKVGNLLKIVEFYGRPDVKPRTVTNTYDRTYRLATETLAEVGGTNNTSAYQYDKANNRTSKVVTGSTPVTETYTYGTTTDNYNGNQLKSVTRSVGVSPTTFQYDANGNRIYKLINGIIVQTYIYDPENRLTTLTDTTLGPFAYTYDHRTRRVGRNEPNTSPTEISFSGGLSVQERPIGTATPTVELIRGSDYGGGIGGVLYTIRSGIKSFNAYNSRGDVVSKTDDTSAITYQASYEAYGTRTQEQGSTQDRQKANTKDEDPTGLINEHHRYRDLEFGIFLTRDPAGFVDGPNVYTYVRQNPWTFFDPLGLKRDLPVSEAMEDGELSKKEANRIKWEDGQAEKFLESSNPDKLTNDKETKSEIVKEDVFGNEYIHPTYSKAREAWKNGASIDEAVGGETARRNRTRANWELWRIAGSPKDKERIRMMTALYEIASISTIPLGFANPTNASRMLSQSGGRTITQYERIGLAAAKDEMGSLTSSQARQIQSFVDKYRVEVNVVGSRASGTATSASDFDYVIQGTSRMRHKAEYYLPRGTSGGANNRGIDIFREPLDTSRPFIPFKPAQ